MAVLLLPKAWWVAMVIFSVILGEVTTARDEDDDPVSRQRRSYVHPHTHLTAPEMIRARGYPCEIHRVVTDDGYILELHRIPYSPRRQQYPSNIPGSFSPKGSKRSLGLHAPNTTNEIRFGGYHNKGWVIDKEKKVAFIQHCLLCSSADFVMNDPDQALGFMLADDGYDVWLGNVRGNVYSRRHLTMSPKNTKFWDFSFDTCARYDVPAMLKYIRTTTGVDRISYIGHSLGTSMFFAMMNYHPHINSWIRVMAAMSPVAYMHNKHSPLRFLSPIINNLDRTLAKEGKLEFMTPTRTSASVHSKLCSIPLILPVCQSILDLFGGPSSRNVDPNYVPVIVAHTPAGTSFHMLAHLLQIVRDKKFQAFDWGTARNFREYGTPRPPRLQLSAVTVPVGVFWSNNDWVADPRDVQQTARELPNLALNFQVQHNSFNHLDFLWAEDAGRLVYRYVIDFLNQYY